jgi:hypothetical protein
MAVIEREVTVHREEGTELVANNFPVAEGGLEGKGVAPRAGPFGLQDA